VTFGAWILASLIIVAACVVQGSIGIGLGLLGAPLLVLIEPRLLPGPLLFCSLILTTLVTYRDWHGVRFADLGWALPGRLLGTAVALVVLRAVAPDRIGLFVGIAVLAGVTITASGFHLPLRPGTLFGAGTLAGFFGTTTSVGGPPMALVYQREPGPRIRGTLSAFFVVGVIVSLIGLHFVGRYGAPEWQLSGLVAPAPVIGFALSQRSARWVDQGRTATAVLIASAVAGVLVVLRELLKP
jgi:uncharacterized membrane protein YfcA